MQAQGVGEQCLDHIAVRTDQHGAGDGALGAALVRGLPRSVAASDPFGPSDSSGWTVAVVPPEAAPRGPGPPRPPAPTPRPGIHRRGRPSPTRDAAPSARAVRWPVRAAAGRPSRRSRPRRAGRRPRRSGPLAAASGASVCWQRSSGEETMRSIATSASRSAMPVACDRPVSSRLMPGVRPASTPEVLAVDRPCRSRITVVTQERGSGRSWAGGAGAGAPLAAGRGGRRRGGSGMRRCQSVHRRSSCRRQRAGAQRDDDRRGQRPAVPDEDPDGVPATYRSSQATEA